MEHRCQYIIGGENYLGPNTIAIDYNDLRYECCGKPAHFKLEGTDEWLCAEHYDALMELTGDGNFADAEDFDDETE